MARMLIDAGADVNKATTDDGTTPLYIASGKGFADVARMLIDAGADVNRTDNDNRSALGAASFEGHADVVRLLISSKADLNIKGKWGTPLKEAIDDKKPEVVKILRAAGAREA